MASKKPNPNKALIELRLSFGLSQTAMADALGVSFRMYQYYEAGATMPEPVTKLVALIEAGKYDPVTQKPA